MEYEEYMNVTKRELAIAQRLKYAHELVCTHKKYNVDETLEILEETIAQLEGKQEGK